MSSSVALNWYFLSIGWFVKIDANHYLFSNTRTWKINNHFFHQYFPSPSVCHKNLRFCWELLRTIIYSFELEKLIILFLGKKMKKCKFVLTDIYRKIYRYTLIYRTPIYRYINCNISILPIYRYIVAVPSNITPGESDTRETIIILSF